MVYDRNPNKYFIHYLKVIKMSYIQFKSIEFSEIETQFII